MAKVVSLKKIWHLCNAAIKSNYKPGDVNIATEAYKLYASNLNEDSKNIIEQFGQKISPEQFESLCVLIEKQLSIPIRDGDFLIKNKDLLQAKAKKSELIFYLHNIRSGFNVGSMIRLADGFNINKVVLAGYTAASDNSQVNRASLGAELNIETMHDNNSFKVLDKLKDEGYQLIALETTAKSENLVSYKFKEKTVLIVGNEKNGLSSSLLNKVNDVVHIPMYGTKNSLNVTSALSIASYEWSKQWR